MVSFVLPVSVYQNEEYNDLRRGYILLIASLIEEYLIDTTIDQHAEMIIAIEKSCYDDTIAIAEHEMLPKEFTYLPFEQLYRTRIMRITKNIDVNSEVGDEHLATGLLSGAIDPTTVSKLENKDLCPSRNEKILEEFSARMNTSITLKTSSLYKCRQCGHKETTVRSMQMRSLDESQTIILCCTFCGYKWFI